MDADRHPTPKAATATVRPASARLERSEYAQTKAPGAIALLASRTLKWREGTDKYLTVFAVIFLALSPGLFFSFGYHNDFNAWAYDSQSCCMNHPETAILFAIGRYFGAMAQNFQFLTIKTLHDLWVWRLIGVVSTALLAVFYLRIVSSRDAPTWCDACLAIAVFTLPTMQYQAIWVSMYMFWTPPFLCALIAARLLLAAVDRNALSSAVLFGGLAFLMLLVGTFFYPASVTLVLVPAAHLLVTRDAPRIRLMAVAAAFALGAAFVALFVIHKFIVLPRLTNVPYLGEYEYAITKDVLTAVVYRLREYIVESTYFWLGFEVSWFPAFVGLVAAATFVYLLFRLVRRSLEPITLVNGLMAAGLFLVAAAPLVVVQQFTKTYRITFTMTAIVLLVLFWLLKQLPLRAVTAASGLAILGVPLAFVTTYAVAAATHAEDMIYFRALTGLAPKTFHPIAVLHPIAPRRSLGLALRNDFSWLSATIYIADLVIGPRFTNSAAFEMTEFALPPVTGAPAAIEKNSVVVDLSPAFGVPSFDPLPGRVGVVSAQPRGGMGPMYAVDGNPASFWEVCGQPFPIDLELELPAERILTGYSMSTLEAANRMPNSWEIWVSTDLENWRQIQRMSGAGGWKVREARQYAIDPPLAVRAIKLRVTGADIGQCLRLYEFTPTLIEVSRSP